MRKRAACILQALALCAGLLAAHDLQAQQPGPVTKPAESSPESSDPNAWTTRVYRYASTAPVSGAMDHHPGQVLALPMPAKDAGEKEILDFLRRSSDAILQHFRLESAELPKGSLAAYDPVNQTLVVRTTKMMHDVIAFRAKHFNGKVPQCVALGVRLVEADGATMREVVKHCSTLSDHTRAWRRLEELAAQGKARHLGALRLDARSGNRATISRAMERYYPSAYSLDDRDQVSVVQEVRPVGTNFEVDPVFHPDGVTVHLNLSLEHHFAPPTLRWEAAGQLGGRGIETQVIDFHTSKVTTSIAVQSGTTRLLNIWKPETSPGVPATDVMQAAFLKTDLVSVMLAPDNRVESLLKTYGEKVVPMPKVSTLLPPGMLLRSFRVPPDFLTAAPSWERPIASSPGPAAGMTSMELLKAHGINFPPGSSATFTPATCELLVRNTQENLAQVELLLAETCDAVPSMVIVTVDIVQTEGAILRKLEEETATIGDHGAVWSAFEKEVAAGRARILRTLRLETRSGQRATTEEIHEHLYVSGVETRSGTEANASSEPDVKKEGEKTTVVSNIHLSSGGGYSQSPSFEMRPVGVRLEVDPFIAPDGQTVDLNYSLDFDYAPPTTRRDAPVADDKPLRYPTSGTDFHQTRLSTAITLCSGMTRLLSLWKPEGAPEFENADILQAAFIRVDVVSVEPETK